MSEKIGDSCLEEDQSAACSAIQENGKATTGSTAFSEGAFAGGEEPKPGGKGVLFH